MEEKRFRNKIYWFTFIFSLLVVWVHSYNSELFLGQTDAAAVVYRVEHWLGETVAQISVPGFFMISGYLFYRNFTWKKLWPKWNSRIRSVLVPFIVWNSLYYLGYVIASRIPYMTDVVGKGTVPFDWFTAVEAILYYTYNYVFWYLYQLIQLIALAPLIYLVLKHRYVGLGVLVCLMAGAATGDRLWHLNLDALFYYSVSAYAALHTKAWVECRNKKTGWLGLFLLLIAIGLRYLPWDGGRTIWAVVMFRLMVPVSLWLMIDESRLPQVKIWMKYNFFLYAIHFALVRLINKTAAMVIPSFPMLPLIIYMLMPAVVSALSFYIGAFLRTYMPRVWRMLNGGR